VVVQFPCSPRFVVQGVLLSAASFAIFLFAVWQLAPITRWLWPIPVAGFVIYPYLKRWTWLCHVWLGIMDGLAPVGGWVAITGKLPWQSWVLGAAVAFWVAGFDLFYALFDVDVDRKEGLHSIATRFGVRGVFVGARIAHAPRSPVVAVGPGCRSDALLDRRRRRRGAARVPLVVRPNDLRRLDTAFFTMNGVISVVFCAFVIADAVV
jgi:4-hydroxybenzoate polyprenyltransferase